MGSAKHQRNGYEVVFGHEMTDHDLEVWKRVTPGLHETGQRLCDDLSGRAVIVEWDRGRGPICQVAEPLLIPSFLEDETDETGVAGSCRVHGLFLATCRSTVPGTLMETLPNLVTDGDAAVFAGTDGAATDRHAGHPR